MPVSRTAPEPAGGALSADVTTGPGNPGPNSGAAFSDGSDATARPLSVSNARRMGPGALVGAIIQTAPRSSGRGGRSAMALAGAPIAAPTWMIAPTNAPGPIRLALETDSGLA